MTDYGVPYGFLMAVEHFSKPPPRDAFERIIRETNAKFDKLVKHTYVRLSHIAAQDCVEAQKLLRK